MSDTQTILEPLEASATALVTAIVVTYNSAHCVEFFAPLQRLVSTLVVVDNGSEDDTGGRVAALTPAATWLPLGRNLGFGAANNRGAALARTKYLLLINPDCQLEAASLDAMVAVAQQHPEAAMVAPRLIDAAGRADDKFRWWGARSGLNPTPADAELCAVFLSGACLLVRRTAFEAVGGFDEGFFLYYEDDDLCARLRLARWSMLFTPAAVAAHRNRGSTRTATQHRVEYLRAYHHARSKLRFSGIYGDAAQVKAQRRKMLIGAAAIAGLLFWCPRVKAAARARGRFFGALSCPCPDSSPVPEAFEPEIIVTCLKKRFTGVSGTINALLPWQAAQWSLAYVGAALPGARAAATQPSKSPASGGPSFKHVSLWQAIGLSARALPGGKPRIWHVRRNHEMLLAIVLRDLFHLPIRVVFTSAAIRRHSALPCWLISRMDGVIATTEDAARHVPNTSAVIGHGVDTQRFVVPTDKLSAWSASGLPGRYGIGIFGRVRAEKGVHVFVQALLEVLPCFPDFTAVIAGLCKTEDQAFTEALKHQLAQAGLSERVLWLGEVAPDDMPAWYQRTLVAVACPLYEGYGLTVIEAMASGCAVVASRTGAFASMVEHGVTGALVPVNDSQALARALRQIVANPSRAADMGASGRARVQQLFSIEAEALGIAEVYRSVWQKASHG